LSNITHHIALDEHLLHLPKPLSIRAGLVHIAEGDVHKVVAVDKVAVEGDAILELDKLLECHGEVSMRARCGMWRLMQLASIMFNDNVKVKVKFEIIRGVTGWNM
jgi:hypothetical protein